MIVSAGERPYGLTIRPNVTEAGIERVREWWCDAFGRGAPFDKPSGEFPIKWTTPDGSVGYVDAAPIRDLIPADAEVGWQ